MYSLLQKVFFAKRDGNDEVVLTLEEAEWELEKQRNLDRLISMYMDYVPESVVKDFHKQFEDNVEEPEPLYPLTGEPYD